MPAFMFSLVVSTRKKDSLRFVTKKRLLYRLASLGNSVQPLSTMLSVLRRQCCRSFIDNAVDLSLTTLLSLR